MLFKISEFAGLAYVSVRLLHHYDRLGLLRPVQVDRDNGYRYYSLEQLPALNRILALKNLGCSLEEIRHLLQASLSADDIEALLTIKRELLARQLAEEQRRLSLVEDYLASIRMEGRSPEFDILIKSTEPLPVLSVRQRVDPPRTRIPDIFHAAQRCLRASGISAGKHILTLYYERYHEASGTQPPDFAHPLIEAAFVFDPLPERRLTLDDGREIAPRILPAHEAVAYAIHRGPDSTRHLAFAALRRWIADRGYTIAAPLRDVYLQRGEAVGRPGDNITEVQIPIKQSEGETRP